MIFREWRSIGVKTFGPRIEDWLFVCLECGSVQSLADFNMPRPQALDLVGRQCCSCGCIGGPVEVSYEDDVYYMFPFYVKVTHET